MKRLSRVRGDALVKSTDGEQGFWPSYADMMSAVALILFFLMLLSYVQNLITGNNLRNTQEVLAETENTLSITRQQVTDAEAELGRITIDLGEARSTLEQQEAEILEQQTQLSGQQKLLGEQEALIGQQEAYLAAAASRLEEQNAQLSSQEQQLDEQQAQLAAQRELIDQQTAYLAATTGELKEMRSQMQAIAVFRISILEQIKDSMGKTMGDPSKVRIGENGSIVLSDSVLFDSGSSEIKTGAKPALDQLIKVFITFLSDEENRKYVDSIMISGHTDSVPYSGTNQALSTDRANAVLAYLLADKTLGGKYAQYFCAAGYGDTRPVASNDTEAGRTANRRIEISIILKDDSIMEVLEAYLEREVPEGATVTTGSSGN